ncbi:hypothetical protein Ddc_21182 [Ditylenchus destructor]|nr:hypothetical protein Ddc_21182 [Ditylenchus destructor]
MIRCTAAKNPDVIHTDLFRLSDKIAQVRLNAHMLCQSDKKSNFFSFLDFFGGNSGRGPMNMQGGGGPLMGGPGGMPNYLLNVMRSFASALSGGPPRPPPRMMPPPQRLWTSTR